MQALPGAECISMWAGEEHLQAVMTAISPVSTRGDREGDRMKTRLSVRFLKGLNLRGEKNAREFIAGPISWARL